MKRGGTITDGSRTEDNDKLREKVTEALAVFNEYMKTQNTDPSSGPSNNPLEATSDEPTGEGEGEGAKA